MTPLTIFCLLFGIGFGTLVFLALAKNRESYVNDDTDAWAFNHLFEKLYRCFLGNQDPITVSERFGLEYDSYIRNCKVIGKEPNMEKECMMRITGIFFLVFTLVLTVATKKYYLILFGVLAFYFLSSRVVRTVKAQADSKRRRIVSDLPRFIDMFVSALEINLPIETAIIQTAENIPGVLSDEFLGTFAVVKLGSKNWQTALDEIAVKYEIDQLSDFVANLLVAYQKGVSVLDAVIRESGNLKQSALLKAKEETAKMQSKVLFPLMIFKMLPMLLIMLIPVLMAVTGFYN